MSLSKIVTHRASALFFGCVNFIIYFYGALTINIVFKITIFFCIKFNS
jgi:hypothetical protein